jgi:RsiW-degrading membrane proteinase PrsW (M82 family)
VRQIEWHSSPVDTRILSRLLLVLSFFILSFSAFATQNEGLTTGSKKDKIEIPVPAQENIESTKSRTQYFADGDIGNYIVSLIRPYFQYSRMSYVAALLIFLIYLFYFRYIDIYEYEPWKNIILTFLAGIFFADMGLIFYDSVAVFLGWTINDNFISDLFYTIFVIGGIEESVKIIPLLFLLRYTKVINEPVDYIVYAGVAALGFAFSENVMYFDRHGASIVLGRALTAVALHTSLSAIVAYGFVLRDYRKQANAPLKMFLIAISMHGLYDFFLINPLARTFAIISYLILFSSITIFNGIISNSLSNSPYYNRSVHLEIRKIQTLLIGGLVGIFLLQFLLVWVSESMAAAEDSFMSSLLVAAILIPALALRFGNIQLHPRKWKSIRIPFLFRKIMIDDVEDDLVNVRLQIRPLTRNKLMNMYLPNAGIIYKQQDDSKKRRWFYVKLDVAAPPTEFNNRHIIIRSKFGNELFNKESGMGMAGIYLVNKATNKPAFIGWAAVEKLL